MTDMHPRPVGRPRQEEIDHRVLEVARRHLAQNGYAGLSMVAVASEAGTTRPSLYRRWPSKAALATAAIAAMSLAETRPLSDDPFSDLVRELAAFRAGISRPDGLSMVGTMLADPTDRELVRLFRERIVRPRRKRLRAILQRAVDLGILRVETDSVLDLAVSTLTGSWYASALANEPPSETWELELARYTWSALGVGRQDQVVTETKSPDGR